MAGSIKYFVYTDDVGNDFAIRLDESNTEAVNGQTQDYPETGVTLLNELPRNVKPREIFYSNATGTRVIRCVALTAAIYSGALNGGVPSITDPIAGTGSLSLVRANGERRRLPFGRDTGLNDGDES